ncbi:MAG: beta-ketoacyl-ACP synthase II [Selenomonadaceae bacterium]|nr:beta-ketoacyl-ACP synthase II [Selenomonadaceae bacterium]
MSNRVVITGMGAITPIGIGKENFWKALIEGKNGIKRITHFDPTDYPSQIAAEVNDFNSEDYMDKKDAKRMDHYTQFSLAASKLAIADAKIDLESVNRDRFGVIIGSGIGGIETLHSQYEKFFDKGPSRISPFFIPMIIPNIAAGQVAIELKLHGPSICIATACATGTNCIGEAFKLIQRGGADLILAGGTEASISQAPIAGFCAMKALCTDHNDDPEHASRPFDKNRSGFVMGEGSGVVVLESLDHAKARGAHIYAEITGYGTNCDAYHITSPAPHGEFQAKCMQLAIDDADVKPEEIDYINAHGTSTHMNDEGESEAIKTVFGEHAKNLSVSSIKSMIGHLLGAAGGVECIATALTIENDIIPPTINYETPDENMDLDYVPNVAKKKVVNKAISNSFGFGGHNACILLQKFSD